MSPDSPEADNRDPAARPVRVDERSRALWQVPRRCLVALDDDRLAAALTVDLRRAGLQLEVVPGGGRLLEALRADDDRMVVVDAATWRRTSAAVSGSALGALLRGAWTLLLEPRSTADQDGRALRMSSADRPPEVDIVCEASQAEVFRACQLGVLLGERGAAGAQHERDWPGCSIASVFVDLGTQKLLEGFSTFDAGASVAQVVAALQRRASREALGEPLPSAWRRQAEVEYPEVSSSVYDCGEFWLVLSRPRGAARLLHLSVVPSSDEVAAALHFAGLRLISPPALSLPPPRSSRYALPPSSKLPRLT